MSHHDEHETCPTCKVLHYDGPMHVCNPYAARWPEGPTDAEVKRGLNSLMSKMATTISDQAREIRTLKAETTRLTARWEALKAWSEDDYVNGVEGALHGSRATWDKMAELEAQR